MFAEFINQYGTTIMYALVVAIAGYFGTVAKGLYTKYVNDKIKQAVAKTVVRGVEQIYQDLRGDEKLDKALEAASEMLEEKGISISDLELRMLIEAAVAEFNDAFNRTQAIIEEVKAEDLDAEQLREVALQMGLEPAADATREDLLAMIDQAFAE